MASREAGGRLSLAVMGGAGVGKTSLVMGLCGLPFTQSYDPTVEDEVRHQLEVDGVLYTLDILDTGGDEEFCKQPWIQQHARDYDGVVLVYAINNYRSFELLEDLFLRPVREASPNPAKPPPVVVVANKADLAHMDDRSGNFVAAEELEQLATRLGGVPSVLASAKHVTGVHDAFEDACREALKQKIVRQGYLLKAGGAKASADSMDRRFVILSFDTLRYFANDAGERGKIQIRDVIAAALEPQGADGTVEGHFYLECDRYVKKNKVVEKHRKYLFRAENGVREAELWGEGLSLSLSLSVPLSLSPPRGYSLRTYLS